MLGASENMDVDVERLLRLRVGGSAREGVPSGWVPSGRSGNNRSAVLVALVVIDI